MSVAERFAEERLRCDLAHLLSATVSASGQKRIDISRKAGIHKDALRRILIGERSATLGETSQILIACGIDPKLALILFFLTDADQTVEWAETDIGAFLEEFLTALPVVLGCELGTRLHELRPRWAKGTAYRVARLLADHIEDLERRDVLLGYSRENYNG